jgi:ribose-phosphate pyrophosphokinase
MTAKAPLLLLSLNSPTYVNLTGRELFDIQPIPYTRTIFPGGEVCVALTYPEEIEGYPVLITARVRSSEDVMVLLMLTDALHQAGVASVSLKLPYFPYGRQDRVASPGESFSAKVFAQLLNAQAYERIIILEPHSDVTAAVLDRVTVQTSEQTGFSAHVRRQLAAQLGDLSQLILVSPDAGAEKRLYRMARELGIPTVARGSKRRAPGTNQLSGFDCDREDFTGRTVLIVDDLCDAGGTFVGLGQVLRDRGAIAVYLMVTHGLLTKGLVPFVNVIDGVFTTNSFRDPADIAPMPGVTLDVFPLDMF